ncbi:MAG TPA: OsmC family protein [Solirubrobacteraceae bacterium]|nr:OsmC family protein [Solirubrobacteraceae bacterium]
MRVISVHYSTVVDTQAAEGRAGEHSVIADRPPGVAGGKGLGFNGGQLLALAIGGCLCNDLRYVAHARGVALEPFELTVDVHVDDDGDIARVSARVDATGQRERVAQLLDEAVAASTIVRAVMRGAPIDVALA